MIGEQLLCIPLDTFYFWKQKFSNRNSTCFKCHLAILSILSFLRNDFYDAANNIKCANETYDTLIISICITQLHCMIHETVHRPWSKEQGCRLFPFWNPGHNCPYVSLWAIYRILPKIAWDLEGELCWPHGILHRRPFHRACRYLLIISNKFYARCDIGQSDQNLRGPCDNVRMNGTLAIPRRWPWDSLMTWTVDGNIVLHSCNFRTVMYGSLMLPARMRTP